MLDKYNKRAKRLFKSIRFKAKKQGLQKASEYLEAKILELKNRNLSNRQYRINISIYEKVQSELHKILPVLVEQLYVYSKIDKSSYRYKARFTITLDNISEIKGYNLLQKYGYYNKNTNPTGVVKDHRFSIKSGIDAKIPPKYLGNINNCEFLLYKDNILKSSKNSISFNEFCSLTGYNPASGVRKLTGNS